MLGLLHVNFTVSMLGLMHVRLVEKIFGDPKVRRSVLGWTLFSNRGTLLVLFNRLNYLNVNP